MLSVVSTAFNNNLILSFLASICSSFTTFEANYMDFKATCYSIGNLFKLIVLFDIKFFYVKALHKNFKFTIPKKKRRKRHTLNSDYSVCFNYIMESLYIGYNNHRIFQTYLHNMILNDMAILHNKCMYPNLIFNTPSWSI